MDVDFPAGLVVHLLSCLDKAEEFLFLKMSKWGHFYENKALYSV
jgi:hypothetical protein